VTTSARISWTLPPEELLGAAYIPSLWTVQKIALLLLVSSVLGALSFAQFLAAPLAVHRRIANAPRKRNPALKYPNPTLF
jgi:hypothetical protein